MPLDKAFVDELKQTLTMAKQRRFNFGLCLGKKPDATVLLTDKLKAPDVLARSAKKQGETPHVTWGELAVDGNKICLYCQGDIVPGLQKKMKEFIKATALPFKVVILDASGGVLEGDDEAGAEDPLAAEWRTAMQKFAPIAEAVRKLAGGEEIFRDWQACIGLGDAGDLRGALTAVEGLVARVAEVRRSAEISGEDRKRWEQAEARLAPILRDLAGQSSEAAKKTLAAWAFAKSKAEAAPPDYGAAIKAIATVVKLIELARAEAPPKAKAEPVKTEPEKAETVKADPMAPPERPAEPIKAGSGDGSKGVGGAQKLEEASEGLTELDKQIADYLATPLPKGSEKAPQKWTDLRDALEKQLAALKQSDDVDAKKAEELPKSLAKVAKAIAEVAKEKAEFLKAWDLAALRIVPLERHSLIADPLVKVKMDALRAVLDQAADTALAQDFKKAVAQLKDVGPQADALEVLADGLAHYRTIHTNRAAMVSGLVAHADKKIDKLRAAAAKLLTDAEALAGKEKFDDAVKKLDQIPALTDQFTREVLFEGKYQTAKTAVVNARNQIGTLAKPILAVLKSGLGKLEAAHTAALFEKTGNYSKSTSAMWDTLSWIAQPLWNDAAAVKDYLDAKAKFDPVFEKFRKHPGQSGVQSFFGELDRARVQADSEARESKWGTAAAILSMTEPKWAAQEALADEAAAYLVKRKQIDKPVAEARKTKGAETLVAKIEILLSTALSQFRDQQFDLAEASLDEVEATCAEVKARSEAKKEFDKAKDDKALKNAGKDTDKALKTYAALRVLVAGKDSDGVFAARLAQLDAEAQKARDEAKKAAPDADLIRTTIEGAVRGLEEVLPKAMAAKPFADHLAATKLEQAKLTDPDGKLTPQIDEINALVARAEALAKPPAYDFDAAEPHLLKAEDQIRKALADAALWPTIKADREQLTVAIDQIAAVTTPAVVTFMKPDSDRLKGLRQDIDDLIGERKFVRAAKLAAESTNVAATCAGKIPSAESAWDRYKRFFLDLLPQIQSPDQHRAQSLVDAMEVEHDSFKRAAEAGNYDLAFLSGARLYFGIQGIKAALAEYALYEADRVTTEVRLQALRLAANESVADVLPKLEADYLAATKLCDTEKHVLAKTAVNELLPKIEAAITTAAEWKAYEDALKAAEDRLDALEAHAQADTIAPMIKALRARVETAVGTAGSGDAVAAKVLLGKIPAEADKTLAAADAAKSVADKASEVGSGAVDPALLAEAQALYDGVNSRPDADLARNELNVAKGQIAAATAAPDAAKAAPLLKAAMKACILAQTRLSQIEVIEEALSEVDRLLAALKSHDEALYLAKDIKGVDEDLAKLRTELRERGPGIEGGRVKSLTETCGRLQLLGDAQKLYVETRAKPEVGPRLKELEEHPHRYSIKALIDKFRKLLDEAAKKSVAQEPAEGTKLLEKAATVANGALVMAKMRADEPPTVAEVTKILEGSGGSEELDAMIDELEPEAMRKVLRVAFEARFGCKLEVFATGDTSTGPQGEVLDGNLSGPDIKRFYQLMSKLPKDHVVKNDSMRTFTQIEDSGGSWYSGGNTKQVVMREGKDKESSAYLFGQEHEVGNIDKECQPADTKEVKYFAWNTLHEVGHAVDDRLSFMDKNGKGDAFGGWVQHGGDIQAVANAVADHFKYDRSYVAEVLAKAAAPTIPPKPKSESCSDEEWEMRRGEVHVWYDLVLEGNNPWKTQEIAKRIALGGRVYQESYGGSWTSYNLDARKRGMTGYQFRAPGEWFAELYAAYHSDKLKPSHPAVGWLSSL